LIDPRQNDDETTGRKAATQDRILRASMELFSARGFDRTSISQIAARSGVSRATIFWHFGNKATLFQETCRHFLVPFRQSLERSLVDLEPRARVVDQLAAYEHFVTENRATIHAFVSWVFSSPEPADSLRRELLALHTAFVKSIEHALGELLGDPREAAELTTTLVSLLHGNMLLALAGAPESGSNERGRVLQNLLHRALASAPQQRR
jgi:AcrR family transcriptional regulator